MVAALNKVDLLPPEEVSRKLEALGIMSIDPVIVSARTSFNLEELKRRVAAALGRYVEAIFIVPEKPGVESLIHDLYEEADSVQSSQREGHIEVMLKAVPTKAERLRQRIEEAGGRLTGYRLLGGESE